MKCRLLCVLHGFCLPYKTPLRNTLEPLAAAAPLGLLTGDLEIACRATTGAFCGVRVESIHQETKNCIHAFREMEQELLVSHLSVFCQMLLDNLRYPKKDPCLLTGDALDEKTAIERVERAGDESVRSTHRFCFSGSTSSNSSSSSYDSDKSTRNSSSSSSSSTTKSSRLSASPKGIHKMGNNDSKYKHCPVSILSIHSFSL